MVKLARSVRSMLPVSCSAVTRRAIAVGCVCDTRARQAHLLETRASGGAARQVVRRPALAMTWQPAFVAPPRRAGAVICAKNRRASARGAVSSVRRKKPASRVAVLGGRRAHNRASESRRQQSSPADYARVRCKRALRDVNVIVMAAARRASRSARVDTPQTSHSRCRVRGAWWAVAARR